VNVTKLRRCRGTRVKDDGERGVLQGVVDHVLVQPVLGSAEGEGQKARIGNLRALDLQTRRVNLRELFEKSAVDCGCLKVLLCQTKKRAKVHG
jgi:hypothetical protein